MKRCPKCNTDNTDSMNFCVECGNPLGNTPSDDSKTAVFPNPATTQETQTVVTNFPPTQATFDTPQPTIVTNQPSSPSSFPNYTPASPNTLGASNFTPTPPAPKKSSMMLWIVGGIAAIFILGFVGIVGIGAIALLSQKPDDPTPTPFPTRSSPVPSNTPFSTQTPAKTPNNPQGTELSVDYEDMWVDFNVMENGKKGMRLHVSFTTRNMKNVDSYLAIYFQKNDGTALTGKDTAFRSKSGQVAVFKLLRPAYDVADFKDQQLFIPYTAFSLPPGKYNLQAVVNIIYKTDGLIQHLNNYDFEFEQK